MNRISSVFATLAVAAGMNAQTNTFDINTSKVGAPIPSTMYGIFFEDINYAADGGLYAELIKNRSFEFPDNYAGWTISGKVSLKDDGPFKKNPHYVRLAPSGHRDKHTMIENEGFFGIGVKTNAEYRFSVWARVPDGGNAKIWIDLVENATMTDDQKIGNAGLDISGKDWKKYTVTLKAKKTLDKAHLRVWGDSKTTTDLEHVSLFPVDTYKGHENGMRKDLAESLEQLKPGVFRFPGGCIVEGTDLATRYQWKNSVGPVENRPLNENRWHYTFTHRYFPDYFQSYGLGFYEYFLLSEEIGAEPLPVLNVGMSCQFQNGIENENEVHVPLDQLQPYIDDCIDLIDFANGDPATNQWAKLRADMGHPEPFNLKYLGVGNEQWDYDDNPAFTKRLKIFVDAIRKVHPEIKLIGTTGPNSEGKEFDMLQPRMKEIGCDLYDEHFYRDENWFLKSGNRYDNYDRSKKAPKVFAGEYACHGRGKKWNHFNAALMEAAFMTDLERNADIVEMATYAPLFAHVEGWQWRPDAIWYDNLRKFNSCSYYVQQLYSLNKGTNVLPLTMNGKPVAGNADQNGLFASAVLDKKTNEVVIKVINTGDKPQPVTLNLKGMKKGSYSAQLISFHSDDLTAENTLDNPTKIVPQTSNLSVTAPAQEVTVPARTFYIYRIKK
ncbi:MAG: alpha-L-arabinofuranosidase C-terminal domain-containing protein [Bacteroidales bacterium]|nr:alpha-L-arabinofuranosidase C-terminal domain-containing protein [Bacteroidales bacterium]